MLKRGGGSIVNTSSVAGHNGMAGVAVYVASKHAVEGITKSAALELAESKIRVNAVAPAAIETAMIDRFAAHQDQNNELNCRPCIPSVDWADPRKLPMPSCSLQVSGHSLSPAFHFPSMVVGLPSNRNRLLSRR